MAYQFFIGTVVALAPRGDGTGGLGNKSYLSLSREKRARSQMGDTDWNQASEAGLMEGGI